MDIAFGSSKLEKEFNDDRKILKSRGQRQGKLILRRLVELTAADNLEVLRNLPGRYHALAGDKDGWFSVDLDGQNRFIFEPNHNPLPTLADGGLEWSKVTAVTILGVLDTHERKNKKPV